MYWLRKDLEAWEKEGKDISARKEVSFGKIVVSAKAVHSTRLRHIFVVL